MSIKNKVIAGIGGVVVALGAVGACTVHESVSSLNEAREVCEAGVVEQAKYPGSVEFVDGTVNEEAKHSPEDPDLLVVNIDGEVDFANGFGTPVRHTYSCTVDIKKGEQITWTAKVNPKSR